MRYLRLVLWQFLLVFVGYFIGTMTGSGIEIWYQDLNKSILTPPDYVFGIVWSVLYLMISTAGWLIWESKPSSSIKYIKSIFIVQLLLNWCWSPLFFVFHMVNIALLTIVILVLLVGYLVVLCCSSLKLVSLLLMPYLLWLSFAAYLNGYISFFN